MKCLNEYIKIQIQPQQSAKKEKGTIRIHRTPPFSMFIFLTQILNNHNSTPVV